MIMAHWQASGTRSPPKTKAELRQMFIDAACNTRAAQDDAPDELEEDVRTSVECQADDDPMGHEIH